MSKKTALSEALSAAAYGPGSAKSEAPVLPSLQPQPIASPGQPKTWREGRVNITGYFDPSVKASIRLIQAKHPGRTTQDLLGEALNDLFAKYNVPQTVGPR